MTTTIDTLISNVESEIKTQLKSNVTGIKDTTFDDTAPIWLNFPSVLIHLTDAIPNDLETNDPRDLEDFILRYDIVCAVSGMEKEKTFQAGREFTNKVYDVLRGQKARGKFLNGNCLDIEIDGITYGYFEVTSATDSKSKFIKGGMIKLLLRVVEER